MNVSQPVAASIGGVDFSILSADEIRKLSVKRIQNPTTYDSLLHPIPGGLYDKALGGLGDNACDTCNLGANWCPGHVGHIELPVPVYHPIFMDQLFRLLRAKCVYCHRLRLSRSQVNHFACKLRLIQHGLLKEAAEIDAIDVVEGKVKGAADDASDSDASIGEMTDSLMRRRTSFTQDAIRRHGLRRKSEARSTLKIGAVAEARRAVIKDFMAGLISSKRCANCAGISPTYRKDGFTKVFERPLPPKHYAQMVQGGFKITNASVVLQKQRRALRKREKDSAQVDEGIVADIFSDVSSDGSDEGEDDEVPSDNGGDLVAGTAAESKAHKASQPVAEKERVQRYVNAGEVHAALTLLFEKDREILSLVYNSRPPSSAASPVSADMFFISCLLVPPSRYRPEGRTGDSEAAEAAQNSLYRNILTQCQMMNVIHRDIVSSGQAESSVEGASRPRTVDDLQEAWVKLQDAVNALIDKDRNPLRGAGLPGDNGIKQLLEKKEGLFRKNMMGKRVNFAARSVISPDPNIETNEIGVPPVFAKKLTYPEPVTNHNFRDLKEAVLNGMDKWPGAAAIENENGQVISLRTKNVEERQALANQLLAPSSTSMNGSRNKKVHRHLNNGDVVLMNRQPTLHKPSIMAHRARVLPGEKTIRMHYANCNTYNADFDGDEMNMHFPQNEVARAEALQIADTDHQYLVATSGKPLRGLIQDHISMGVCLSNKDTFFDRETYQQLLYACLRPEDNHTCSSRIMLLPPCIRKPRPLWTGKQVVSTVLRNLKPEAYPGLTLTAKCSTAGDRWGADLEEGVVAFQDGVMISGVLDKSQLGPAAGGLIHSIYEVYGHVIAGRLLSVLGRLLTKFLHMRAFTCGMDDLVLTKAGDGARREKLKAVDGIGLEVAAKYVSLADRTPSAEDPDLLSRLEEVLRDNEKQSGLDRVMNARTGALSSEITMACLPAGLVKPFPRNQMQTMTASGAKGSSVNANLISCNLGQQVLEGRRVPTMVSGRTLPCFRPFDTSARAGGYIVDRFLTGIRPQEYYFHAMAGREGLIDTAVKTSRSGYLQRCLIKGMEGLRVAYDDTIRDADGSLIQFLYGEDGLDVTKQKHLMDFRFIAENFWSHFEQLNVREEFAQIATDEAMKWSKKAMKKVKRSGRIDAMDPVMAHFSPGRTPYSTSERFTAALAEYVEANPQRLLSDKKMGLDGPTRLKRKAFETVMNLKYLKAVVEPGEAVGIIAGQSIGEPSTQMTLNTFHLAGHSAKNVTLGIPRLREIVMSASKDISTPSMTLHLNPEITPEQGETFAKVISRLTLAEVVDQVSVTEEVAEGKAYGRAKIYRVRVEFYPRKEYHEQYAIDAADVAMAVERSFVPILERLTRIELKKKREQSAKVSTGDAVPEVGRSSGVIEQAVSAGAGDQAEDEAGEEDGDDDGDASNVKSKANRSEAISYEAPDEGEETIMRQMRRESTPMEMEDEGIGGSPGPSVKGSGESEEEEDGGVEERERSSKVDAKARKSRILGAHQDVTDFAFDEAGGQWCEMQLEYATSTAKILMLSLVEKACREAIIQAVPGIGRCSVTTAKEWDAAAGRQVERAVVVTEGVNLAAMQAHQGVINPHKLFANDIHAMLRVYGVEACRATIIREMGEVFEAHSIAVDARHLLLIADCMTRAGGFAAFNRLGMRAGSTAPLLKMSFETTVAFLRDAVLDADFDPLASPSSRIVLGKVAQVGSGVFDVLTPLAVGAGGGGGGGQV